MATITGYTATRMKQIEAETIVDGKLVGEDLVLVRRDLVEINVGSVKGEPGEDGEDGSQGVPGPPASFAGYTEPVKVLGNVSGNVTLDFSEANIWRLNPTGSVTFILSNTPDGDEIASGTLFIENSDYAIIWPVGTMFTFEGAEVEVAGFSILPIIATETEFIVGNGWVEVA